MLSDRAREKQSSNPHDFFHYGSSRDPIPNGSRRWWRRGLRLCELSAQRGRVDSGSRTNSTRKHTTDCAAVGVFENASDPPFEKRGSLTTYLHQRGLRSVNDESRGEGWALQRNLLPIFAATIKGNGSLPQLSGSSAYFRFRTSVPALSCRGEIACRLVWSRNALKSNSDRRLDSNTFTITIRSSEPPLTQTGNRPTQRTFGMLLAISGLRSDFGY